MKRLESIALDAGLDPIFAKDFLKFIISEVIRHHKKIHNQAKSINEI